MSDKKYHQRTSWRKIDFETLQKKRYSIQEVSQMFNIPEYTLRYWEKESVLSPERSPKSGARMYQTKDLQIIEKLYYLLEIEGLTLPAAKKRVSQDSLDTKLDMRDLLLQVRDQLQSLRAKFSAYLSDEPAPNATEKDD